MQHKNEDRGRDIIVMQPGPLHLFWTTGVFYIWFLSRHYDFALIVPQSYRNSINFSKLRSLPYIKRIVFAPNDGSKNQKKYFNCLKNLLVGIEPTLFLMHNISYPENQYLLWLARKNFPRTKCFQYQNGRMELRREEDFKIRRTLQIKAVFERIKLPKYLNFFIGTYVDLKNAVWFMISYKIKPVLVILRSFSPVVNVMTGKVNRALIDAGGSLKADATFAYLDVEAEALKAQGATNLQLIQHPMTGIVNEVMNFLNVEPKFGYQIIILPSYGFVEQFIANGGDPRLISEKWIEAINQLQNTFKGYSIGFKLHPAAHKEQIWDLIITHIKAEHPHIEIVEPALSAEIFISIAEVIVGDVSTALWWAALQGDKHVISYDIFGYDGGDEMADYSQILTYINDTKKTAITFGSLSSLSCPSMLDFINLM
ncbi:hypothetical protein G6682_01755 [Polynucleobacter paneuropaeus]|jgi:hypothetical protein|nr:hypothetical protein G6682_01755 [Polynucleobacter paneuropaeus]